MNLRQAARDPWVWGQLLLLGVIALGVPLVVGARPGPHRVAGLGLLVLGLLLAGWAAVSLGRSLTPSVVPLGEGRLIVLGPYRVVRHPIYGGVVLAVAGWAMLTGTWWTGLAAGLVAFAYFDRKSSAEERHLLARYPDYAEYRARVPKLIPRL